MAGIVVAPQPVAAEAGAQALRAGGNAFDAAVAAGFTQAVVDPFMCGIGGMGVAQIFRAGESLVLDFYGRLGSLAREDQWAGEIRTAPNGRTFVEGFRNEIGYGSVLIPGTVAGLASIHRLGGRLPWRDLVEPAARLLQDGYPLYAYIADYFYYPFGPHTASLLQRVQATEAMSRLWLREDGSLPAVGDPVVLADYARSMERLAAAGPDDFYRGDLAESIVADLQVGDATLTADDLASFRARSQKPLEIDYRGFRIRSNPAPGGGPTVLQVLKILEGFDLAGLGPADGRYLHLLVSALKLAFADREELGDPDFVPDPTPRHLSEKHAAAQRERIQGGEVQAGTADAPPGTTHLTTADTEGNVVAVTHTLGTGSGVVTPGLGFQYNNGAGGFDPAPGRANSPAPGKARLSGMAPTMVFKDSRPILALGSPGSNAIISAVIQVIVNVLDFGLTPLEAVSAPRVHCEGAEVLCETRLPAAAMAELQRRGHQVVVRPFAYDTLQGRVQAVYRPHEGSPWLGASDPRRDGGAAIRVD